MRSRYSTDNFKEVSNLPYTSNEQNQYYKIAAVAFHKIKYWLLLPPLAFLILLMQDTSPKLISVLLDNSSSMENEIQTGREAISSAFNTLDDNTDIVLGWLSEEKIGFENADQLVQIKDYKELNGKSYYFSN